MRLDDELLRLRLGDELLHARVAEHLGDRLLPATDDAVRVAGRLVRLDPIGVHLDAACEGWQWITGRLIVIDEAARLWWQEPDHDTRGLPHVTMMRRGVVLLGMRGTLGGRWVI